MKLNIEDRKKAGIYCIKNKVNGKVYVGKAKDVYRRIKHHKTLLNTKSKDENRHLIYAWHKYGEDSFEYVVLEYLPIDEILLKEREIHWTRELKAVRYGYNIREESETRVIVSEESRTRMSIFQTERFKDPLERLKSSHTFWKDNPDETKKMARKVSEIRSKYYIDQYNKETGDLIKRWDKMTDILDANPTYKRHNIYAVCSGEKPSMYGFKWKRTIK